ncbi:putative mitochondrial protein [Cucumis melo var. makuwa]|uniref:Mitochondrial protein n=1 Tax=Cucumis melo var. makuwa TaxID=1194695 RepID=A0A5A7TT57_CUCMM|nr:putative mitochondrial protein [Cucumis melo var. makuwa]
MMLSSPSIARNKLLFLVPAQSLISCSGGRHFKINMASWLLTDMGAPQQSPIILHCDNCSVIEITHNDVFHERTKHIENDCHFVRHHLQSNIHQLQSISPPINQPISSPKPSILLPSLNFFTNAR